MNECMICCCDITTQEFEDLNSHCRVCYQNLLIKSLSKELRDARITFEELIRKLMDEINL